MHHRPAARLALALLGAALCMPAAAGAQAYTIPPDNPFAGTPGARPEIYVLGMRNPYRWSFDALSGDMYVGDVGGTKEEVTRIPRAAQSGANLGWNCFSGTDIGPAAGGCDPPGDLAPTFQYDSSSDVVIGGYAIRDPALPGFAGRYVYARFNSGVRLRGVGAAAPETDLALGLSSVSGFGEDGAGHIYVTSLEGPVRRIVQDGGTLAVQPVRDFEQPLGVAAPPGDPNRLFVFEKGGRIMNRDGSVFLDLTTRVIDGGEQGLLSVAVARDYAVSGRVYAFYNDTAGDLQIDSFRRTALSPDRSELSTRTPILTIPHGQADNHNGGQLLFGPDGLLYVSTGDGGTQGDPEGDAQSLGSLLGKILRIDVTPGGSVDPPPVTPPDATPPVLRSRAPRSQRVLRLRGAVAFARCSEACTVRAGGRLRIRGRRYRMTGGTRASQSTGRLRLKVVLTRRGRVALRRALRRGRRASVRITLRATDLAGNRSPAERHLVRVRR